MFPDNPFDIVYAKEGEGGSLVHLLLSSQTIFD